jgi:hypothetical protein
MSDFILPSGEAGAPDLNPTIPQPLGELTPASAPIEWCREFFRETLPVVKPHLRVLDVHGPNLHLLGRSFMSGRYFELWVNGAAFLRWGRGAFAGDAFPTLSIDVREFLISGLTPDSWAATSFEED